jgi:hypothetical protein
VGSDCLIRHRAAPVVASAGQRLDGMVRPAYQYVAIAVAHADAAMTGAVGAPEDTASGSGQARFASGRRVWLALPLPGLDG